MTSSVMAPSLVTQAHVDDPHRDGVVLIRGLFTGFVDPLRAAIERDPAAPATMPATSRRSRAARRASPETAARHERPSPLTRVTTAVFERPSALASSDSRACTASLSGTLVASSTASVTVSAPTSMLA